VALAFSAGTENALFTVLLAASISRCRTTSSLKKAGRYRGGRRSHAEAQGTRSVYRESPQIFTALRLRSVRLRSPRAGQANERGCTRIFFAAAAYFAWSATKAKA
jgi:hypothetical protein